MPTTEIKSALVRVPVRTAIDRCAMRKRGVTPSRIAANFAVHDFELSAAEMATLEGLNADARFVIPTIEGDYANGMTGDQVSYQGLAYSVGYIKALLAALAVRR